MPATVLLHASFLHRGSLCVLALLLTQCTGELVGAPTPAPFDDGVRSDAAADAMPLPDAGASTDTAVEADLGLAAPELSVRFLHLASGQADPRFEVLPAEVSRLELAGAITLEAVASGASRVRFEVNGEERMDDEAPFRWTEDDAGEATPWLVPDEASVVVEAFNDAGERLANHVSTVRFTREGFDPTPDSGEHQVHKLWLTESDRYVTRNEAGDFVDSSGEVVLAGSDLDFVVEGNDRGYFVPREGVGDGLAFAFIVLLPDGYRQSVAYPIVVLLHNGYEVYFGNDNDGRVLGLPIVGGENSIATTDRRHDFPAIVLIPQLVRSEVIDGVWQQWAAFETITDGDVVRTEEPGYQGALVLRVLDDLLAQRIDLGGVRTNIDPARQYLTGHSMGSIGAWDFVAREPERWAASVMVSGYPDLESAPLLEDEAIWAFHHVDDCINPAFGTQTMAARIQERRGRMHFTAQDYEGTCREGHTRAAIDAWKTPELLPWFFSQLSTEER